MKKHILSKYGRTIIDGIAEIKTMGPTIITESSESTDQDSFLSDALINKNGPTLFTKSVESSDPDDFNLSFGPTNLTFTKESTDEDSIEPSFV